MKSNKHKKGGLKIKIVKKSKNILAILLFTIVSVYPITCNAKEDSNANQNSKPKTQATEKSTKAESKSKNEEKNATPKNRENSSGEGTNQNNSDVKKEEPQSENAEKPAVKEEQPIPKMNSILPEKSDAGEQKANSDISVPPKDIAEEKFDLPEIKEDEFEAAPNLQIPESENKTRDMPKTVIAWILIGLGIAVIIATIILNLKIPHGMNLKYHEKHGARSHKNKYNLRYK